MSNFVKLDAEKRQRVGKGASRAARRNNMVPAVIYGGKKEPSSISIPLNEIVRLINRGGFLSHTYAINAGGDVEKVVPRDLQLHPITDIPMHIDFLRLSKGSVITMNIPVHIVDEEECPGLKKGGVLNMNRHDLELNCPGDSIPESITISIANLEMGDSVKISNVDLPAGVTPTITDRDFIICTLAAPSAVKSADEEAEDAEATEGEATTDAEATEAGENAEGEKGEE